MSNLILGRGPCPRPSVEAGLLTPAPRLQGIFHWELGKFDGPVQYTKAKGSFTNLITNAGLDRMGTTSNGGSVNYIAVGTGSSTPAAGQTSLDAEVFRTSRRTTGDQTIASGPSYAYWSVQWVYLFIETEANGNLTEVGLFNASTSGVLFARQLFKDLSGTPTTIVKTSADQLKITYELRLYSPTSDTVQTGLVISGTSYNFTTRARAISNALMWGWSPGTPAGFLGEAGSSFNSPGGRAFDSTTALGATTGGLSGTNAGASSSVMAAYSNGNYYRDNTITWEPADGNLTGGIGGFHSFGGNTIELFQTVVSPVFAKTSVKRLIIVARCAWARYP